MRHTKSLLLLSLQGLLATEITVAAPGNIVSQGPTVLSIANANAGNYGCWCRRIGGNDFHGTAVIDSIDLICKQWNAARRCMSLIYGDCEYEADNTYSATDVDDYNTCSATNTCGLNTCKVDLHYVALLKAEITSSGTDTSVATTSGDCAATPMAGDRPNTCSGTSPNVVAAYQPGVQVCPGQGLVPGPFAPVTLHSEMGNTARGTSLGQFAVHEQYMFSFDMKVRSWGGHDTMRNVLHFGNAFWERHPHINTVPNTQNFYVGDGCKKLDGSYTGNYVQITGGWPLQEIHNIRVEVRHKSCTETDRTIMKVYVDDVFQVEKEGHNCFVQIEAGNIAASQHLYRGHLLTNGQARLNGLVSIGNIVYQDLGGTTA